MKYPEKKAPPTKKPYREHKIHWTIPPKSNPEFVSEDPSWKKLKQRNQDNENSGKTANAHRDSPKHTPANKKYTISLFIIQKSEDEKNGEMEDFWWFASRYRYSDHARQLSNFVGWARMPPQKMGQEQTCVWKTDFWDRSLCFRFFVDVVVVFLKDFDQTILTGPPHRTFFWFVFILSRRGWFIAHFGRASLLLAVFSGCHSGPRVFCDYLGSCGAEFARIIWGFCGPKGWESLALLQRSFRPFGPKLANRVRKWVPGPSRPRGPKTPKRNRKKIKIVFPLCCVCGHTFCSNPSR